MLDLVSDIAQLGFELQCYDEAKIAAAVTVLRTVNPEVFDFLVRVLAEPALVKRQ